MGLIDFLEAPLGGCKGAPQKIRRLLGGLLGAKYSSRSPLWPTPGITKMKITKKRHFFKNRWNTYFYNDSSAYGKTTTASKRSFGRQRALLGPPVGGTLSLGTPLERPRSESFPPGCPPGPPKTDPGTSKAPQNRPREGQLRPRATSNPQSEHA